MNKIALILIIGLFPMLLVGCSGNNEEEPETEVEPDNEQQINTDPELSSRGYHREQITDPALYDYNQKTGSGLSSEGFRPIEGVSKVGLSRTLSKYNKYNLQGIAQIISDSKIRVSNFSYNGGCGPIKFGLALNNKVEKPLAIIKELSSPMDNATFEMTIPGNISLIQFELLAIYCPTELDPISEASFD